jgi:hypothetical protein
VGGASSLGGKREVVLEPAETARPREQVPDFILCAALAQEGPLRPRAREGDRARRAVRCSRCSHGAASPTGSTPSAPARS